MVSNFLKKVDLFGHNFKLTIKDGNGMEQTSKCGGVISLFIYCFMVTFFIIKTMKMQDGLFDYIMQIQEIVEI